MVAWLQVHASMLCFRGHYVAIGAFIGLVNGLVILRLKVPSLIATLACTRFFLAWLLAYFRRRHIPELNPTFEKFGQDKFFGTPVEVFYVVVCAVILYYVLELRSRSSDSCDCGNPDAARLSGVNVNKVTMISLIACSTIASIGESCTPPTLQWPLNAGNPYLLAGFAAVFLGSTQIQRGRVNVLGTLVAIYVLAEGVNGLELAYPSDTWVNRSFGSGIDRCGSPFGGRKRSVIREI